MKRMTMTPTWFVQVSTAELSREVRDPLLKFIQFLVDHVEASTGQSIATVLNEASEREPGDETWSDDPNPIWSEK